MSTQIIAIAAGVCFVFALLLTVASFTRVATSKSRTQVEESLATINSLSTRRRASQIQPEEPFADRVIAPLRARAVELGKKMTPPERRATLRRKLEIAGNPLNGDVDQLVALKTGGLVLGGLTAVLLLLLFGLAIPLIVIGVGLAFLGLYAPDLWVYQTAYNRSEQIRRSLPDALDMLTVCVESGQAFTAAMGQVARNTQGPLAGEFARVLREMQIGTSRADALTALGERTNVEELQAFVNAMVQADRLGVSMAKVLRVQSSEMRLKRSQRAEELAQKVPVKILFPLMFCILPCLFIVVIGPAIIKIASSLGGL